MISQHEPTQDAGGAPGNARRFARSAWTAVKPVLRPLARAIRWFRRAHMSATIVSHDGSVAFSIIGTTRWLPRFRRLCLGSEAQSHTRYAVYGSSWVPHARRLAARHGVVVVSDAPFAAQESELLNIPTFVAMRVDLGDSEPAFQSTLSRSALADIQKVKGRTLTWSVQGDVGFVEEFYRRYHRPSIAGRHGDEGFVMSASEMAAMVTERGCEFVCVYQDGRLLGAILNGVEDNAYALYRVGWLDGDPRWPKLGVTAALYWFSMQRARQLGLRDVTLGGTPPMLEAGVFQFKTKWNALLDPKGTVWGSHPLLIAPSHANTQRMLRSNSFVVLNRNDEFIVISGRAPGDVNLSAPTWSSISRWYQLRETPAEVDLHGNADLPRDLRCWFRQERMPR